MQFLGNALAFIFLRTDQLRGKGDQFVARPAQSLLCLLASADFIAQVEVQLGQGLGA